MNIDEMPAGRELDALVAEKVMGWKQVYYRNGELLGLPPGATVIWGENIVPYLLPVLGYSTDIAAAWRIVERLHSINGVTFWLTHYPTSWYATFENLTGATLEREGIYDSSADSAPLAICRSALKFTEHVEGK